MAVPAPAEMRAEARLDADWTERGMTLIPRRSLDVGQNEIARAFKLAGGAISPLSFMVPRKAESFQSE